MHPFVLAFVVFVAVCGGFALRIAYRTAAHIDDPSTLKRYEPYEASMSPRVRRAHTWTMLMLGLSLIALAAFSFLMLPHHKTIMAVAAALIAFFRLCEMLIQRRFKKPTG